MSPFCYSSYMQSYRNVLNDRWSTVIAIIQRGWADVYGNHLDCQWIDITNVNDGQYVLECTTNKNHLVPEDDYGDNTIRIGLDIRGTTVREIPLKYQLDAVAVKSNGALAVSWVVGIGSWQGPVEISPPTTFGYGSHVALARQ